jgi:cytidylate kinase
MAFVIAVDGPAASGKGTIASRLAAHYGFPFLDTGLLYRAVGVRLQAALLDLQRGFARKEPGAVLDGRDIGTVIAPDAQAKLFVTASPQVRAERRWKQLTGQGETVAFEDILADIRIRDERDSGRASAPLVQARDAVLLDTSQMTIEAAFDAARRIVEAARAL